MLFNCYFSSLDTFPSYVNVFKVQASIKETFKEFVKGRQVERLFYFWFLKLDLW